MVEIFNSIAVRFFRHVPVGLSLVGVVTQAREGSSHVQPHQLEKALVKLQQYPAPIDQDVDVDQGPARGRLDGER